MKRRRGHALLALVGLAATAGCVGYSAVAPEAVTPRTELHLRFVTPRAVTFRTEAGDSLVIGNVIEVRGRLIERMRDSIAMRATHAETGGGEGRRLGPGATAVVALADVGMQRVDRHVGRTILLIAVIGLGLVVGIAAATYEEPPPPPPKDDVKCCA